MAVSGTDDLTQTPAADPGDSFEQLCWNILRRRYRPEELVYLPAAMGGDYGIEGFSADGIAYQCYADRESQTLRHRTDKQVAKLNADTLKLQKNRDKLQEVLGAVVLDYYFLLVPEYHAVELVAHCTKRAAVVRGWHLSFISDTFAIRIKTPHDYPSERNAALSDAGIAISLPSGDVAEEHVHLFTDEQPALVAVMDQKLQVLQKRSPGTNISTARDRLIRAYLAKEQIMDALREWPLTWENVEERRQIREYRVELESALSPDDPNRRLLALVDDFAADLADVPGIRTTDSSRLAQGQVGEWLMRCPLDFGDS